MPHETEDARKRAQYRNPIINKMGVKLLYAGFETCFALNAEGAAVR